ncbi:Pre-mRNA-splicing factor ATP-dependent RNA helicase prp22 [Cyphellophora attinorum]|uniref:Pre-mRNA-splicing factor ATP-dependent RNA helicase prp22 n=1 Tax=Cyphellophora attinorum TaxID=1664694 RepID=A0A0N1HBX3_9EURO|nr:Pre-mRNA-splicing factor ATP-dependent RNA helicase prp22 [Phialophora attinorum]KPI41033.1 Pre-mRNA-splicing factor ATP-dependent RNA helicase prp22 [Phialophora attinorum]
MQEGSAPVANLRTSLGHEHSGEAEDEDSEYVTVPPALVAAAVVHLLETTTTGDILVFLPGMADIEETVEILERPQSVDGPATSSLLGFKIFKLHSLLSDTNGDVFNDVPSGERRVILSTNIAETSITLPGVRHVIDTGTSKDLILDHSNGSESLLCTWIDQQSQRQRRGRAGRTSPGNFYALYTKSKSESLPEYPQPELHRRDLTDVLLRLKLNGSTHGIEELLSMAPDPPPARNVQEAIHEMKRLGALSNDDKLTPLGRVLSQLPVAPRAAKALLLGILFRCFEPMLIAAAAMSQPHLIQNKEGTAREARTARRGYAATSDSDTISIINAVKKCREDKTVEDVFGLGRRAIFDLNAEVQALCNTLTRMGLLPRFPMPHAGAFPSLPPELSVNAHSIPLIKALLGFTIEPETAVCVTKSKYVGRQGFVVPHRTGVNFPGGNSELLENEGRVYEQGDLASYSYASNKGADFTNMMQTSMMTHMAALLTCQNVSVSTEDASMVIDETIKVKLDFLQDSSALTPSQKTMLLHEYRKMIERFLHLAWATLDQAVLEDKYYKASVVVPVSMFAGENALRDAVVQGFLDVLSADAEAHEIMLADRRVEGMSRARAKAEIKQQKATQKSAEDVYKESFLGKLMASQKQELPALDRQNAVINSAAPEEPAWLEGAQQTMRRTDATRRGDSLPTRTKGRGQMTRLEAAMSPPRG